MRILVSITLPVLSTLLFCSHLLAFDGILGGGKLKLMPDKNGYFKLIAGTGDEHAIAEFNTLAGHLATGEIMVVPSMQLNQFYLEFPQTVPVNGEQVGGVMVTATNHDSQPQNLNHQNTFSQMSTQPSLSEHDCDFPTFSVLNVLSQPNVLTQVNQLLSGQLLNTEPVTVPDFLEVGESVQVSGFSTELVNQEGNIQVNSSETGNEDDFENHPTVTLTTLTAEQLKVRKEAYRVQNLTFGFWLLHHARKLCSMDQLSKMADRGYWVDFYQWTASKGKYGKDASGAFWSTLLAASVLNTGYTTK